MHSTTMDARDEEEEEEEEEKEAAGGETGGLLNSLAKYIQQSEYGYSPRARVNNSLIYGVPDLSGATFHLRIL